MGAEFDHRSEPEQRGAKPNVARDLTRPVRARRAVGRNPGGRRADQRGGGVTDAVGRTPSRIRPMSREVLAAGRREGDGQQVTPARTTRIARTTSPEVPSGATRERAAGGLPPGLRTGLESMSGLDLSG